jgi:hypothetical protein
MTKDIFIANPLAATWEEIPAEWVREGWAQEKFREDLTYVLARSVSKTGGFNLVGPACLSLISLALSKEQAAELYVRIRDASQRFESEWRSQFTALFPQAGNDLPLSNDAGVLRDELEYVVASGDDHDLNGLLDMASTFPEIDLAAFANQASSNGFQRIADRIRGFLRKS